MKSVLLTIAAFCGSLAIAAAAVKVDEESFGKSLGGWNKRANQAAEYPLSGATYRTYKPEVSPTPDGGIFISVRIDHVRGWLSSDDHAILEVTINAKGLVESAQSNIAIQGRSISSDVILGSNEAGKQVAVGTDRAVQIGTDLVANLSAKLLREKIVEAGRVSFPAALRHNYNLLFQAIRMEETPAPPAPTPEPPTTEPPAPTPPTTEPPAPEPPTTEPPAPTPPVAAPPAEPAKPKADAPAAPDNAPLDIQPYATPRSEKLRQPGK